MDRGKAHFTTTRQNPIFELLTKEGTVLQTTSSSRAFAVLVKICEVTNSGHENELYLLDVKAA